MNKKNLIPKDEHAGREVIRYKKTFTEDEIASFKDDICKNLTDIDLLEKNKKETADEFKAKIDEKKDDNKLKLLHVNNGFQHVSEECDVRRNNKEKTMMYYNKAGVMVQERPMTPEERQLPIPLEVVSDDKEEATGSDTPF